MCSAGYGYDEYSEAWDEYEYDSSRGDGEVIEGCEVIRSMLYARGEQYDGCTEYDSSGGGGQFIDGGDDIRTIGYAGYAEYSEYWPEKASSSAGGESIEGDGGVSTVGDGSKMVLDIVRSLSLRGALGFATLRGLRGHNRGRCILKLTEVIKGPSRFGGCNTHCCWRLSCLAHFITRNSVSKVHIRMVEPIRTTAWKWAWMAFHSGMYENVALQVANRAEGPAAPRTGVIPHLGRRTLALVNYLFPVVRIEPRCRSRCPRKVEIV